MVLFGPLGVLSPGLAPSLFESHVISLGLARGSSPHTIAGYAREKLLRFVDDCLVELALVPSSRSTVAAIMD